VRSTAVLRRRAGQESAGFWPLFRVLLRAALVAFALVALLMYPGEFGLVEYLGGFRSLYVDLNANDTSFFFWGTYSGEGWPWFGLACVVFKSTLGLLALSGAGALLALSRRPPRPELAAPLLLVLAVVGVSAFDRAAFGLRRVLPAYPGLFVLGGAAAGVALEAARRSWKGKLAFGLALALVASHIAASLRAYPNFIPYLNELAGGSARATDYFTDSNLDWGQALPELKREIERRHPARVKLLNYGRIDPAIYGLDVALITTWTELEHPEPGILYALSATRLVQCRGLARTGKVSAESDWLRRFTPVARPGDAIYVYEFREKP
jgi:hypothetical protein